ncbi:MAG: hypothetical protein H6Q13_3214, partial [Bacteroidetes bacterium]|nr:hypothetical protein [Bacteroidota bacterium]
FSLGVIPITNKHIGEEKPSFGESATVSLVILCLLLAQLNGSEGSTARFRYKKTGEVVASPVYRSLI